jgi:CysZ protein
MLRTNDFAPAAIGVLRMGPRLLETGAELQASMSTPTPSSGGALRLTAGDGLAAFAGGVGFIAGTPRMWPYAVVPVGLMLLLACCFGAMGIWGATAISDAVMGPSPEGWSLFWSWLLRIGISVMMLFVALLLAVVLAQPLSSFALEAIVRAQHEALGGAPLPELPFFQSMLHGLWLGVLVSVIGILVTVVLFLITTFVPPAAVVVTPLEFVVVAALLAWNFLDYPLGLRGLNLGQRLQWIRGHFWAFIAFGLAWSVVLLIPGVFLLLLPMGVAGATRLAVRNP